MLRIVTTCVLLLIVLNGCAKVDQIVYVPQKCHVQIVNAPTIEECDTADLLEWGKCAYKNYLKEKEARELQVKNAEICK